MIGNTPSNDLDGRTMELGSIHAQKGNSDMNAPIEPQPTKALPLRAYTWHELWMAAWGHGTTWGTYERRERLNALPAVEEMSLEELTRTQYSEPDTESRKAFYAGIGGVLSLEALGAEHDARRYGTPYETVDPITQKQIEWEQRAWHSGPVTTGRKNAEGRVVLDRYADRSTFLTIKAALDAMPAPRPKTRLTREAFREAKRRINEIVNAEIRRQTAEADEIFHSAYEVTHEGEIVGTVTAGSRRADTWHHQALDQTELEIGFHLMADDELEAELGEGTLPLPLLKENTVTDFDPDAWFCTDCGNPDPKHLCPVSVAEAEIERANERAWENMGGSDEYIEREQAFQSFAQGGDTRADLGYGEDEDLSDPDHPYCRHDLPLDDCRPEMPGHEAPQESCWGAPECAVGNVCPSCWRLGRRGPVENAEWGRLGQSRIDH